MCPVTGGLAAAGVAGSQAAVSAGTAAITTSTALMMEGLLMTALSTGLSFAQQSQQAEAQMKYQQAQMKAHNKAAVTNAEIANEQAAEQISAERTAERQEEMASSEEQMKRTVEATKAKGMALASSEGAGRAVEFLLADYENQAAMARGGIQHQADYNKTSRKIAVDSYHAKAVNAGKTQREYVPSAVNRPSPFASALSFGASALDTYSNYQYKQDRLDSFKSL